MNAHERADDPSGRDLDALAEAGELRLLARAMARLLAAAYWRSLDQDRDPDPPPESNAARPRGRADREC